MAIPPTWLARLANRVAKQIQPLELLPPVGCHYFLNPELDQWEVTVFLSRTETVGGESDGSLRSSKFGFDLQALEGLFDEVRQFHWQALELGPEDELGPHISLEGICDGNSVWLRVLAEPPARFDNGRIANAYEMDFKDVW